MKKWISLLLCVMMLLGSTAMAEPFGEGKSLSFACLEGWYSAVSINDNLAIWQEIEKNTGVKIEWEANSDYDTAMQPRIASGQNLPDIMLVTPSWSNAGVYKLAQDGMIIPLDDLIEEHAPNIKKILDENPALKGLLTAPDGKIYTIADVPMFVNDMVVQDALFIREDWLKAVGKEAPVTLEDWYDVLTAFKGYDATGYGMEVIPFSGSGDTMNRVQVFLGAFGLPTNGSKWWYDDEGKVFFTYASEQFRAFVTEMAKWYSEGLLDMEMSRDESNFQSVVATNVVGAFKTLSERVPQYDGLLTTGGVEGNHVLCVPPTIGDKPLLAKRDSVWNHYGITRDCEDPVLAIKWIDYVWGSEEGMTLNEYGIEGLTWYMGEDGVKHYTDYVLNNPDGLDPYNTMRSLGASDTILVRTPAEVYIELNAGTPAIPYGQMLLDQRVEPFPQMMASPEEQEIIDRIQPDLETYAAESVAKFITGMTPMSEFDNFVKTLYEIGLEELTAVKQAHFDRSGMR